MLVNRRRRALVALQAGLTAGLFFAVAHRTTQLDEAAEEQPREVNVVLQQADGWPACDDDRVILSTQLESRRPWPKDQECRRQVIRHMVPGCRPAVALASYPGSGNTWLRYLVEAASGVFTGSIYNDLELQMHGLLGEIRLWSDGTTLVQKTHKADPKHVKEDFGGRGILLLRNPYDAILSQHNFLYGGHVGRANAKDYNRKDWPQFVTIQASKWLDMATNWTTYSDSSNLLVLHYENLLSDLPAEMFKVLNFLRMPADDFIVNKCIAEKHRQGYFRRRSSASIGDDHVESVSFLPFSRDVRNGMDALIEAVDASLRDKGFEAMPLSKYKFYRKSDEEILHDLTNSNSSKYHSSSHDENSIAAQEAESTTNVQQQNNKLILKQYLKWLELDDENLKTGEGSSADAQTLLMKRLFATLRKSSGAKTMTGLSEQAEDMLARAVEVWPKLQQPFKPDPIREEIERERFRGVSIRDLPLPRT